MTGHAGFPFWKHTSCFCCLQDEFEMRCGMKKDENRSHSEYVFSDSALEFGKLRRRLFLSKL